MLCRRPYMLGSLACPCGGCLPCRINRRRVWAHRILLESFKHGDSCFVTLTYDDGHIPDVLDKSHYQLWLKRLRKLIVPRKVRYFLAGEYGEDSGRPHFHAALFGLDRFTAGGPDGQGGVVQESWGQGYTYVGELTWDSAQYIAGYLTKKVQNENSHREFCRMSLRPGIGAGAMGDVARVASSDVGLDSIAANYDVPHVLAHGKRMLPLGRYLRRRLRGELGFASKDTPKEASRLFAVSASDEVAAQRKALEASGLKSWVVDRVLLDIRLQKINNLESRFKVRDCQRKLK